MITKSGHLTYCSNIHTGENWSDHFNEIRKYFPLIKNKLSPDQSMGLGLRLSNMASLELCKKETLLSFQNWLYENQAYIFTMNGFPYGGFHHTRVKDQVHSPDWTTNERVEYTLRLFKILTELVPDDLDGGVSTSPLSYRHWFHSPEQLMHVKETATKNILRIAKQLINIHRTTGRLLHLDIEPEPDGLLETGMEFIEWFEDHLLTAGISSLATDLDLSATEAENALKEHIRLCYDICHFAIGYEPHADIVQTLTGKGIKIGKIQISAALKAFMHQYEFDKSDIREAFSRFDETTYLHQVVAQTMNNDFLRYKDLPDALQDIGNPIVKEWRAHFHVPVFEKDYGILQSTQSDIIEILDIQKNNSLTKHLEVETYTWEVLPEPLKLPLQESITRELEWVTGQLI